MTDRPSPPAEQEAEARRLANLEEIQRLNVALSKAEQERDEAQADLAIEEQASSDLQASVAALISRAEAAEQERGAYRTDRDNWETNYDWAMAKWQAAEAREVKLEALLRKWHAATDSAPIPLIVIGDLRRETTELLK